MKSIEIQGKKREIMGKYVTRKLRIEQLVPCSLYGNKEYKSIHFYTEVKHFKSLIYTSSTHIVTINLENDIKIDSILQNVQFHPVSDIILHADFYQLYSDKPVTMEVPIRIIGYSKGVILGGLLRVNMRKIRLKALPKNIPNEVIVDVSKLEIGDKIYINQLDTNNYIILHSNNEVVVTVIMPKALK